VGTGRKIAGALIGAVIGFLAIGLLGGLVGPMVGDTNGALPAWARSRESSSAASAATGREYVCDRRLGVDAHGR
jgi:hypothetical protein